MFGMEHDFIIVSSGNEVTQVTREYRSSEWKVEYLGEFIEVSYVYSSPYPLNYIRATFTVE